MGNQCLTICTVKNFFLISNLNVFSVSLKLFLLFLSLSLYCDRKTHKCYLEWSKRKRGSKRIRRGKGRAKGRRWGREGEGGERGREGREGGDRGEIGERDRGER